MKQIVFLLYDSRSGSTLLSRLLNDFKDIGVTVESNFMVSLLKLEKYFLVVEPDFELIAQKIINMDRFKNLKINENDIIQDMKQKPITIGAFVENLLNIYFSREKPGADIWIIKDGSNGHFARYIIETLPTAKFIHIIRDGRAVLNSRMKTVNPYGNKKSMSRDPLTTARHWVRLVSTIDTVSTDYPEHFLEVKYEDIIINTDRELQRIREFLGLHPCRIDTSSQDNYYSKIVKKEQMIHTLVNEEPKIARCNAWKKELPDNYRKLFELIAGNTLKQKGYSLDKDIKLNDIFTEFSLLKLFLISYKRRLISWLSYIRNPRVAKTILQSKRMMHHKP